MVDNQVFEKHITITSQESNALAELEQVCSLSIAEIKKAISKGALWLTRNKSTQRFRRLKKTLKKGDELHFYFNENILNQVPNTATLIEDMGEYSVWCKPYGMLSQGSKWSDHCTIARWAQTHLQPERPVFIVHRLDRAASGLIIIAHTKTAAQAFSKKFELHQLKKQYLILTHGDHTKRPQPDIITTEVDGKAAQSEFTCINYNKELDVSLNSVVIGSGRKHQIRLHSASIGMPVVGDRLHGDIEKNKLFEDKIKEEMNLQLCAFSLTFECPVDKKDKTFKLTKELLPNYLQS